MLYTSQQSDNEVPKQLGNQSNEVREASLIYFGCYWLVAVLLPYSQKFSPGEYFRLFHIPNSPLMGKLIIPQAFCLVLVITVLYKKVVTEKLFHLGFTKYSEVKFPHFSPERQWAE